MSLGAGRHKDWSWDVGGGVRWYCGNPRYLQLVSAHCLLFPTAFVLDTHQAPLISNPQCRRDLLWAKTVAWREKPVWASACKYVRNRLVGKPPSGQTGPNQSQIAAPTPCPGCVLRQNAQLSDSDTCRNKVVTRVQLFGHFCQIGGRPNFGTRHNVLTFKAVIFELCQPLQWNDNSLRNNQNSNLILFYQWMSISITLKIQPVLKTMQCLMLVFFYNCLKVMSCFMLYSNIHIIVMVWPIEVVSLLVLIHSLSARTMRKAARETPVHTR